MEVGEAESARLIDGLAQTAPFRFVDRVRYLDEVRVVTEFLHGRCLPERFADALWVDTYAVLEFAAQSSGLVLRDRKKEGSHGVIASFRGIEHKIREALRLPLRLESRLVSERSTLYEFDFQVYSEEQLAVIGSVGIVISGR
ncbi:MAG: hypothetical protein LBQ20_03680 [Rhodanobacter sp.]|jgi:hypothetical protein|nr:hypothetical protein [Rhodanobacter sp.]